MPNAFVPQALTGFEVKKRLLNVVVALRMPEESVPQALSGFKFA